MFFECLTKTPFSIDFKRRLSTVAPSGTLPEGVGNNSFNPSPENPLSPVYHNENALALTEGPSYLTAHNPPPITTRPDYINPYSHLGEIDNESINSESAAQTNTISEVFWYAYSSLMGGQGHELKSLNSISVKIVVGIWWFFALIVLSSYTANLAAGLTVTRMEAPVKSFEDLANQKKIAYGTIADTSIYKYILEKGETQRSSEKNKYVEMKKMITKPSNELHNLTDAMQRVYGPKPFAFLWDVAVIEHKLEKDDNCTLMTIGPTIYEKGYGIALKHGSQHRDIFSIGILILQEQGILERLERTWWPDITDKCSMQSKDSFLNQKLGSK